MFLGKNIKKLKTYLEQKSKGGLSKYTKKEQLLLDRKMGKLQRDFAGVMDMAILPDAIFVVDAVSDNIAVREANRLGIKVAAIADSNCDPTEINYPVPGNDDAIKSIKILVTAIASAYEEGKKEAGKEAEIKAKKAAKEKEKSEKAEGKVLEEEVAEAEEKIEKETVKDFERKIE